MHQDSQLWYVKKNGRIKGPFATGLISQNILLGRIHPSDLLSQDKEIWRKASTVREVMPDVVKYRNDPNYKERLKAARRWADERSEVREANPDGQEYAHSPRKKATRLGIKTTGLFGIIVLISVITGFIYTMFVFTPDAPIAQINCASTGRDGSVFDRCHLQGRDFSRRSLTASSFKNALLQNSRFRQSNLQHSHFDYANLSNADLTQADFSGASMKAVDLRGAVLNAAVFTDADMSYADLTGAKAAKIKLTGAKLANTIWFDGHICAKESVGSCLAQ